MYDIVFGKCKCKNAPNYLKSVFLDWVALWLLRFVHTRRLANSHAALPGDAFRNLGSQAKKQRKKRPILQKNQGINHNPGCLVIFPAHWYGQPRKSRYYFPQTLPEPADRFSGLVQPSVSLSATTSISAVSASAVASSSTWVQGSASS